MHHGGPFEGGEHTHCRGQELLGHERIIHRRVEGRTLVPATHPHEHAFALSVEVEGGLGVDHQGPASGRALKRPGHHDLARDGLERERHSGRCRQDAGPGARGVHHHRRVDAALVGPHSRHAVAVQLHRSDLDPETDLRARPARRLSVPERQARRVGDPVLGTERCPVHTVERDPRGDRGRLLGREHLHGHPHRALRVDGGEEPVPQIVAPHDEQVAVLDDVERHPVLLAEAQDHRDARPGQLDVDSAGELLAEPARASPGGARSERGGALQEHDPARLGRREVVRRARADRPPADHDDVGALRARRDTPPASSGSPAGSPRCPPGPPSRSE